MRALVCEQYGPPSSLVLKELPDPVAGPDDAVVAVRAAGINFPDLLIIENLYQVSIPTPFIPGSEFAGVVLSVGSNVTNVQPGDLVMGGSFVGCFAEQISVKASSLKPIPTGLSLHQAAAFSVTYRTAYHALVTIGELKAGDWVVVLGAAGGVGTASVDIATRLGAKVIAVASSDERLRVCEELGAVAGINYTKENLKDRIKSITGSGADLIIDPVGGSYAEESFRAIAWGGRFVVVGFADGEIPKIPLNLPLLKGGIIKGFEIRTVAEHLPQEVAEGDAKLDEMTQGGLAPHISKVFRLEDAREALEFIATRQSTGKVLICP
ncbi:MAG: NADPH:quinone oxidoreductase family protein [Candidatus Nanopelagicales bacterium]|nr:NADPH:quinone oxidoreductase family protein [Candidatus Nanopelagicales bacterium]